MTGTDLPFKIDWQTKSKLRGPGEQSVGELLHKLRDRLSPKAQGISITYVDDRGMRKLNREHRGINASTDVLSFPSHPGKGEFPHLGDLVICLPHAEKMAKKLGVSRRREVETLLIHGFLHLCGHDHEKDKGEMLALQAEMEKTLLETEPLPMALRRGRKPGSKLKTMKDGRKVVVTGRAAVALTLRDKVKKTKQKAKAKEAKATIKAAPSEKRRPGRPRKTVVGAAAAPARRVSRKRVPKPRTGVIA